MQLAVALHIGRRLAGRLEVDGVAIDAHRVAGQGAQGNARGRRLEEHRLRLEIEIRLRYTPQGRHGVELALEVPHRAARQTEQFGHPGIVAGVALVDGPQPVDQNGSYGFLAFNSNPGAITVTQSMTCSGNIGDWAARVASLAP